MNLMREFDAEGGARVHSRIVMTEKYTPEAARHKNATTYRRRICPWGTIRRGTNAIFMGIAFSAGAEEVRHPFLRRRFAVEYELMRSVRVVARAEKRRSGAGDQSEALRWL